MSLFQPAEVSCPGCNATISFSFCDSVNADRRPDLRQEIMGGTFQHARCDACGVVVALPPQLTYMDVRRGQWILAKPAGDYANWTALEAVARQTFELAFGARASRPAREIGKGLLPRIVFGWAALREKLLARENDIDDVLLEQLKLAVVRSVEGSPLNDESELRLVEVAGNRLTLAWLVSDTQEELVSLELARGTLDGIAADSDAWEELRERLDAALFVDFGRLLLPTDN